MMYQDIFTNANLENLIGPARKFNALMVDNAEKVVSLQLEAARSYTDLGVKQLRDALEINDVKSFQDYVSNQTELAKTVAEKAQKDAQKLADIGQNFATEWQKLAQENVAGFGAQPKAAKSKPSTTATSSGSSSSQSASRKSA